MGHDHPLRSCSLIDVWTQPGFHGIVRGMTLLLGGRPTSRNRVGLSFARLNPLNERPRCTRTSQGELNTPPTPQFVQEIKRYDTPQAIVGSDSAAPRTHEERVRGRCY